MSYNFSEIENKWRDYWKSNNTYGVEKDDSKPKYYVLDMFPYPSGAGLHVGHPLGYIASDIFSRYKKLKGFNVLHPMGFDAFGLPAEQYAIETGQHPAVTTETNIKRYKEQLSNIGFSFDWNREVQTCDPEYFKWTQWIFLKLFDSWYNLDTNKAESLDTLTKKLEANGTDGLNAATTNEREFTASEWEALTKKERQTILGEYRLAYQAYAEVNWCPALGTVLANDEVKDGKSERGGHPVERIKMRQWFLRITAYAQKLLDGLNEIDWPDSLKEMQRNWIGRSEGAAVNFKVDGSDHTIEVFTTRPDTIYGATFMVLAPEHELVAQITSEDQKEEIEKYLNYVKSRSDIERQAEKRVTGEFTGAYAINPFTEEKVPVFVAEYVLAGYGTGAVMAVPSRDERDHAFATKFNVPIVEVIDQSGHEGAEREDKLGKMVNSGILDGLEVSDAIQKVIQEIENKGIGKGRINYRLRDAGFSRQRYWGEPFPIVYGEDEVPLSLSSEQLPVELPEVTNYQPTGDGKSPIANNAEWVNAGEGLERETDTMPGYAGSSWYFLRYMDPHNKDRFVGEEEEKYWKSVDLYIGGAEHAVGHLMYARFWQHFLYDIDLVSEKEPFKKLINQGMIQGKSSIVYRVDGTNKFVSQGLKHEYEVAEIHVDVKLVRNEELDLEGFKNWREEYKDAEFVLEEGVYYCGSEVEKMSKRWHNVVNPDDVIDRYGADCFRMYEMFLGPIEQHKPWDTKGIDGVYKFLKKLWGLYTDNGLSDEDPTDGELKTLHKTIKKVQEDIERYSFNTAVSNFMICVNELKEQGCNKRAILEPLAIILSPYAPHVAEELWELLGKEASVTTQTFPTWNEAYLSESTFAYPVSFNGKMRFKLELPTNLSKEEIEKEVLASENSAKWLGGNEPKRVIVVPNKIVNIVV